MDAKAIVLNFNNCINARDLPGLAECMTDDHCFIDSAGNRVQGKEQCLRAWNGFFAAFPDYQNVFETISVEGNEVTISGYSTCSVPELAGPVIWIAQVEAGKLSLWQIIDPTN